MIDGRQFVQRIRTVFRKETLDRDMDDEMRFHLDESTDQNLTDGLATDEARCAAERKFGGVEQIKEYCRDERGIIWIEQVRQDVRYGFRSLRKAPGVTTTVVLTIALGVGATTAIFSVVDATLFRPLPYPQPEQLVRIQDELPGVGAHDVGLSEPEWQDLQRSGIFVHVSPTWYDDNNLTGPAKPSRISLLSVAPNYFSVLGVTPQLGRVFDPADHSAGYTMEVVISDGLWKRDFASDLGVLGRSLRIDTDLYHVVGVMPPGYLDPGTTARHQKIEVWAATSFYGAPLDDHPLRDRRNLPTAIARLRPGLTMAAAQSRIDALVASLQKEYPGDYPSQSAWAVRLVPLKESLVSSVRQPLFLLLGALGLLLLIGCANIANLLLARGSARGREMAIRQALGADRSRLQRQLLTESFLLALLGGALGLVVLVVAKESLLPLMPESLPMPHEIAINWGVLFFAFVVSLAAGLISGLAPAWQAGRQEPVQMFKQGGRGANGSAEQIGTRRILVITEFALSLVLMFTAMLLLRSFCKLLDAPLGFDPRGVMTVQTRLPYPNDPTADSYGTSSQQAQFFREVLRRVKTLPGVAEAAIGDLGAVPLGHDRTYQAPRVQLILEEHGTPGGDALLVDGSIVTPDYFHLMGMTLVRGRLFGEFDGENALPVVVINEAMSHAYWPDESPLGKHLKLSRKSVAWSTVVGVVADARTESLEDTGIPQVYASLYQKGAHHLAIFLRGNLSPSAISDEVREHVQAVDPTLPVFGAQMLKETVAGSLAARRLAMEIVALFAVTALLLAGLGIYGVISYEVTTRTQEFGIRLALGAERKEILWKIVRQGLNLVVIGAAIGLVGVFLVSYLMSGFLFGVKPADPATFLGVAALLIVVGLLACYVPAWRALRADPVIALRHE